MIAMVGGAVAETDVPTSRAARGAGPGLRSGAGLARKSYPFFKAAQGGQSRAWKTREPSGRIAAGS